MSDRTASVPYPLFQRVMALLDETESGTLARVELVCGVLGHFLADYPVDKRSEIAEWVLQASMLAAEAVDIGLRRRPDA